MLSKTISGCKVCLTFSDRQQREPYISVVQTRPWSHLSLDNFEFQCQHFIIILDVSTKFLVLRAVSSLNTVPYKSLHLCSVNKAYQLALGATEVEILFQTCSSSVANIWASTLHFPVPTITVKTLLKGLSEQYKG